MRAIRYILTVLTAALLLSGCRSSSTARRQKIEQEDNELLVQTLLEAPKVSEMTASLSLNLQGTKVSGQLRMRRGRSIQISASMLGLVEIARIEFLPDMVVIMDRMHNLYSVCHYAEIPYRNELGLDFETVQALLWNRIFCPGSRNEADASARLQVRKSDEKGVILIEEPGYGYLFRTNGKDRLDGLSKSGNGFRFNLEYTDFTAIAGDWRYPLGLNIDIKTSSANVGASIKMSSVQTDKKTWPDRTQVSRRMKQVSLEDLLDNLNL